VLTKVAAGDVVAEGQELAIMEAMKMEITLRAPRAGTIAAVQAQAGEFVEADAVLIKLEPVQ
jgi:3-methylcrotonyl-CoA carboxylase alpha subunit